MSNIYIIAPPYTGGNHLLNLILTSYKFSNEHYKKELIEFYSNHMRLNAHFAGVGLSANVIQSEKITLGHLSNYLLEHDEFLIDAIIILLDMPAYHSPCGNRIHVNQGLADGHFWGEQRMLYKPDIINKLSNSAPAMIVDISSELFNSRNTPVFSELNNKLNLGLPLEQCAELHNIWMNKIYGI